MARSALRPRSAVALAGGALLMACVVKDVELVDHLPSPSGGMAHAGSTSGSAGTTSSDAGQTQTEDGGEPATGSGGANASGGKLNQGGSAGAPLAGSAGKNQGGSQSPSEITDLHLCPDASLHVCDDFEGSQTHASGWAPGIGGSEVTDAPSGAKVLIPGSGLASVLNTGFGVVKVSFWVRFASHSDKLFVSFPQGNNLIGLGIEGMNARWLHAAPNAGVVALDGIVAPSNNQNTRFLPVDSWICMEISMDSLTSLRGRVVVPGDAPFDIAPLDATPTDGADTDWNTSLQAWAIEDTRITFGINGGEIEIDDVLVGALDTKSLCDHFLEGQ